MAKQTGLNTNANKRLIQQALKSGDKAAKKVATANTKQQTRKR